eukprot:GHVP01000115.1.p1 GENE.GHVP01000115.1~~GHVP01000115.1.p1  ORF type:complete len:677 (+),score=83.66 GHVP01000115.1:295-2031(+)
MSDKTTSNKTSCDKTTSSKTASNVNLSRPTTLILVPTRELAVQIQKVIQEILNDVSDCYIVSVCGGLSIEKQIRLLSKQPSFIVSTLGRLEYLFQNYTETISILSNIDTLVIDEADRFVEDTNSKSNNESNKRSKSNNTFRPLNLMPVIKYLPNLNQTIVTSATLTYTSPIESIDVLSILSDICKCSFNVLNVEKCNYKKKRSIIYCNKDNKASNLIQFLFRIGSKVLSKGGDVVSKRDEADKKRDEGEKPYKRDETDEESSKTDNVVYKTDSGDTIKDTLPTQSLSDKTNPIKMIIFTNSIITSKHLNRTISLFKTLFIYPFKLYCIHSNLSQRDRLRRLDEFRIISKTNKILICTDITSRGIDISDIDYVINYHLPNNEKNYIHRIGRTSRSNYRNGYIIDFIDKNIDNSSYLNNVYNYLDGMSGCIDDIDSIGDSNNSLISSKTNSKMGLYDLPKTLSKSIERIVGYIERIIEIEEYENDRKRKRSMIDNIGLIDENEEIGINNDSELNRLWIKCREVSNYIDNNEAYFVNDLDHIEEEDKEKDKEKDKDKQEDAMIISDYKVDLEMAMEKLKRG